MFTQVNIKHLEREINNMKIKRIASCSLFCKERARLFLADFFANDDYHYMIGLILHTHY